MLKAVIFDLDGTLLYTLEDLKDSVNFALLKLGHRKKTLDEIRNFVGNGVEKLIELALEGGKNNPDFENCLNLMKEHYSKNNCPKTKPYPSVVEMLASLKKKGIKIGIVSNKYDSAVKSLCGKHFRSLFDVAIGESKNFTKKPAPDGVLAVIKTFDVEKDEVLYVGDSDIDIKTAKNAGIKCVSVGWGYKDREFLIEQGADKLINEPLELFKEMEDL